METSSIKFILDKSFGVFEKSNKQDGTNGMVNIT